MQTKLLRWVPDVSWCDDGPWCNPWHVPWCDSCSMNRSMFHDALNDPWCVRRRNPQSPPSQTYPSFSVLRGHLWLHWEAEERFDRTEKTSCVSTETSKNWLSINSCSSQGNCWEWIENSKSAASIRDSNPPSRPYHLSDHHLPSQVGD